MNISNLCNKCGNAHWLTDDDAGSDREMERLCNKCFKSQEMNTLKETIENTLINNLEVDGTTDNWACVDFESIQRCSDYIAQEIKDVAIEWANKFNNHPIRNTLDSITVDLHHDRLFTEFINQRYKK